jgi:DNA-binding NarL/FixJ family response regulator
LRSLLELEEDLEVVGEAGSGTEAAEAVRALAPDVVVMDVAMPGLDGVGATRLIKGERPEIRIIGLSMFEDDGARRRMAEAGAEAYLTKTGPSQELLAAIRGAERRRP